MLNWLPYFNRPEWFLALIPFSIIFIIFFLKTSNKKTSVNSELFIFISNDKSKSRWAKFYNTLQQIGYYPFFITILIIALAGPCWKKIYTTNNDQSFVFLIKASNKIFNFTQDINFIINSLPKSPIGLIVYSGSTHILSPITKDHKIITSYINALSYDIMPKEGNNIAQALTTAVQLLKNTTNKNKRLILITDSPHESANNIFNKTIYPVDIIDFSQKKHHQNTIKLVKNHGGFYQNYNRNTIHLWLDQIKPFQWQENSLYFFIFLIVLTLLKCRRVTFIYCMVIISIYNFQNIEAKISICDKRKAELLYNKANSFFRKKDYTSAILFYEKTLKILPEHKDAKYNLKQASSITNINKLPQSIETHNINLSSQQYSQSSYNLKDLIKRRFYAEYKFSIHNNKNTLK